jgi:hypothetical protein
MTNRREVLRAAAAAPLGSDVPWETQGAQIVEGLKRAGDIAAAGGVTITVGAYQRQIRDMLSRSSHQGHVRYR